LSSHKARPAAAATPRCNSGLSRRCRIRNWTSKNQPLAAAEHSDQIRHGVAVYRDRVERVLRAERGADQGGKRDHDIGLGDQLAQQPVVAHVALYR